MGCYALFQRIFPTQGSNPGLPTLQADCLTSESPGKPTCKHSWTKTHIYTYVSAHTQMHTLTHMHPTHACTHVCTQYNYVYANTNSCLYTYINIHACVYMCMNEHAHGYKHKYMHTNAHTHTQQSPVCMHTCTIQCAETHVSFSLWLPLASPSGKPCLEKQQKSMWRSRLLNLVGGDWRRAVKGEGEAWRLGGAEHWFCVSDDVTLFSNNSPSLGS